VEIVPKVSDEHLEARREEILEGALRAFARYGYEGATVVRLEEEIGLSRGRSSITSPTSGRSSSSWPRVTSTSC
jgi:ubiquinone biosynthesis protein COQ9